MSCFKICSGDLRTKGILESPDRVPDDCGGFTNGWNTVATVRGKYEEKSGSEKNHHGRWAAVAQVKFTIRYRSDIDETWRVIVAGKAYNIRHIRNLEQRNRWLEITFERGVDD